MIPDKHEVAPGQRIGEFIRQWRRVERLDQEVVRQVHSDPNAPMASLLFADLTAVLEALELVRDLAYRLDVNSPHDGVSRIHEIAALILGSRSAGPGRR